MKLLVLTNNSAVTDVFIQKLVQNGHTVAVSGEALCLGVASGYDLIISYCYNKIISEFSIHEAEGNIVNLHISYLPWNRGSDPNFWSFWDDTPKGVSLHYIDKGLDTGAIIARSLVSISQEDTFETVYQTLHTNIQEMFFCALEQYAYWRDIAFFPVNSGTCHRKKDKEYLLSDLFSWNIRIKDFLAEASKISKDYRKDANI